MSKICGYSCEHNKSGVCQISVCDKKSHMSNKTEVQTFTRYIDPTITELQQENEKLNGAIQTYDILLKSNVEENNQLKLINKEHQQINGELRQANKLLNEQYTRLYKEYEQLKDNWNKLKKDIAYELLKLREPNEYNNGLFNAFTYINNEIQELEQGSDK